MNAATLSPEFGPLSDATLCMMNMDRITLTTEEDGSVAFAQQLDRTFPESCFPSTGIMPAFTAKFRG